MNPVMRNEPQRKPPSGDHESPYFRIWATTVIHRPVIQPTVIGFCRQQIVVDWLWVFLRLTICSLGMHMNILGGVGGLCTPGHTASDDALEKRLLDTPVTVCDCAKFG